MDRAEATGLGVAVVGHSALLVALTLGLFAATNPPPVSDAIEVSFVDNVALTSASPEPAMQSAPPAAQDLGDPEEAVPEPSAAPAPSQPALRQAAPAVERPEPAVTQRRAINSNQPRRRPDEGRQRQSDATRNRRLADLDLSNLGNDPAQRRPSAPAATMSAQAAADIAQAIARQVQPCADRQVYPGPGAERIVTPVILRLNRDGSLAARPRVGQQRGVDDENGRYAQRVADIAVAAFVACSPLRGLPQELYDVPRGWSNFTMNYRLPG